MKDTSIFQKLATSAINVFAVLIIFLPFYLLISNSLEKNNFDFDILFI